MGMMRASRGTIWITISMMISRARPLKRYRAAARAARKARARETSTVTVTTMTELRMSSRKCGLPMAAR
jgi:hypothetical protein